MRVWRDLVRLIKRPTIGLPVVAFALAVGALAWFMTTPRFTSNAMLVLTSPTLGGSLSEDTSQPSKLTNPLLNFDGGLRTTASILIQVMNTREVSAELGVDGGSTKLTVDDGSSNPSLFYTNGPFVNVAAESASEDGASDLVARAEARVRQELLNRQAALGAPLSTYITATDVVLPTPPQMTRDKQLKSASAAFAAAFAIGLAVAYGGYRLVTRRRLRRAGGAIVVGNSKAATGNIRQLRRDSRHVAERPAAVPKSGLPQTGAQPGPQQRPRAARGLRRPEPRSSPDSDEELQMSRRAVGDA